MRIWRYKIAAVSASIFIILLISLSGMAYFSFTSQWQRLQEQAKAHGLALDIRGAKWSWTGIKIPVLEFKGQNRLVKIRHLQISPNLQLAQGLNILGLKMEIEQVSFQSILDTTASSASSNSQNKDLSVRSSEAVFTKLLSVSAMIRELKVHSIRIEIYDSSSRILYAVNDMKLQFSSLNGTLDYQLSQLSYRGRSFLEKLEGTLILDTDSQYLPFLVANGNGQEKNWQAKGHISRDLNSLSIFVKNQGIPREWNSLLTRFIPNHELVNYALRLRLNRKPSGVTNFDIQLGSTNFMFQHETLAAEPAGPIAFRNRFSGKFHEQTGAVQFQSFINLISPRNKNHQFTVQLNAQKSDILERGEHDPWDIHLALRPTACGLIKESLPESILGSLASFQLSGKLGFQARLSLALENPAGFQIQWNQFQDNCQLIPSRQLFTAAFLRERKIPANVTSDMLSPQLRALLSPQFTAHLGPYLPLLLVAAEDTGFWTHNGIEPSALEAALRLNLKQNAISIGGSTITMQTAKNLFLHPKRTLARKFQEVILAKYLEKALSKQEILTIYANIIEYGPELYGIQKASQVFFRKHPHELTPNQALYLASILPSPKRFLINYCQRELTAQTKERMAQIFERFESLRPSSLAAFSLQTHDLGFVANASYVQKYCPMTVARSTGSPARRFQN